MYRFYIFSDVTNVARRGEATPKAREVGVETRGKNDLPYIARARGDGLGGLVALCEMSAPLSDALKAGDVVHGVDFQEITSEIWQRVRLSATEDNGSCLARRRTRRQACLKALKPS